LAQKTSPEEVLLVDSNIPVDFQRVFESSPDSYMLIEPEEPYLIVSVSDEFTKMTLADRDELVGRSVFEVFPANPHEPGASGLQTLRDTFAAVARDKQAHGLGTFRYDIPDRQNAGAFIERHWSPRSFPITDADGELQYILHRLVDVTEFVVKSRYNADAGVASQSLLLVSDDPIHREYLEQLFGSQWHVRTVCGTEAALRQIRTDAPSLVFISGLPHDEVSAILGELGEMRGIGKLPVIVRADPRAGIEIEEMLDAGADDVVGGRSAPRELLALVQALFYATELRQTLEERAHEHYKQLFMQTPVAIAQMEGPDHVFTMSNPAHNELVAHRQVIGRPVREAFPEPLLQEIFDHLDDVYATGEAFIHEERRIPVEEGSDRYLTFAYLPIRDIDGHITGVASFSYDVTELVEMRKAAEASAEQVALESRRKDEFIAMLGHELRNPLAPITTAAEILKVQADRPQADQVKWAADVIARQSRQLSRIVDDLLDVSRISRGHIDLQIETVSVAAFVEPAVEAIMPSFNERNQRIEVDIQQGDLSVDVDRERMVQVLTNLLSNASKYSSEGQLIRLDVSIRHGCLEIEVNDDGNGISPALLPQIFELFVQGDVELARSQGGLGLGLPLVKRLVEMHGGEVEAHSEGLGKGSHFVARLPMTAARALG
jgi:PAS domain S-box-containing protein